MLNQIIEIFKRPPDQKIQRENRPYLDRWFIIPHNRYFNIYLHHFLHSDEDAALHDHPWFNVSVLFHGGYTEHVPKCANGSYPGKVDMHKQIRRKKGDVVFRLGASPHRIELDKDKYGNEVPVWTLFITGPKYREWGFYCKDGWTHWRNFDTLGGCDDSTKPELKKKSD